MNGNGGERADVVVVGSGPAGAMLADALVAAGRSVCLVDYSLDDPKGRATVPDRPFAELRRSDPDQARYFIGENLEGVPRRGVRVGAQLTPPRRFVSDRTESLLPVEDGPFDPMQSLALGGLGAGWGTGCFTFSEEETARAGLAPDSLASHYDAVARRIGVSAAPLGQGGGERWWTELPGQLPGLDPDDNAVRLRAGYEARRAELQARGLFLGPMPLAVLSRDHAGRRANPYHDLDFYGDERKSAYRPRHTVEELRTVDGFRHESGVLVTGFREEADGVVVEGLRDGAPVAFRGRTLALCAGALNSARLALRSLGEGGATTLLCNPYTYMPSVHLPMLGRESGERRHSLAQLAASLEGDLPDDGACSVQIYSYRSLLLFKLVKEMPLPPWAGLLVARLLVDALTIFGLWFADAQSPGKTLSLSPSSAFPDAPLPGLRIAYQLTPEEAARRRRLEQKMRRLLPALRCLPIGRVDPGAAGSIHYAGTIPFRNSVNPSFVTRPDYRLATLRRVFVGDSSSWNWLPHKGPTFTAMANARRIAGEISASL